MECVEINGMVRHVSEAFVQVTEYGCSCGSKYDAYLDDHPPFCDNCDKVPDTPTKFESVQIAVLQAGLQQWCCLLRGGNCNTLRAAQHAILKVHRTPQPRSFSLSSKQMIEPVYTPVYEVAKVVQSGASLLHLNCVQPSGCRVIKIKIVVTFIDRAILCTSESSCRVLLNEII